MCGRPAHLAVVQVSWEAAVLLLAGGGQPGPVAVHTSGLLLPPQLEPILTTSVTDGEMVTRTQIDAAAVINVLRCGVSTPQHHNTTTPQHWSWTPTLQV